MVGRHLFFQILGRSVSLVLPGGVLFFPPFMTVALPAAYYLGWKNDSEETATGEFKSLVVFKLALRDSGVFQLAHIQWPPLG